MGVFSVQVDAVVGGSVAGTFKSMLGLKLANTAGHVARLRRLVIGGAGEAPQDQSLSIRVVRSDNTTDGTGDAVTDIGKADPDSVDSNVTIKKAYSVEPTTIDVAALAGGSVNARGALTLDFAPGDGPKWGKDATLLIQVAPGTATAITMNVTATWEE